MLVVSSEDAQFLSRLFGPRVPDEMAPHFLTVSALDFAEGDVLPHAIRAITRHAIEHGARGVLGWRLSEKDGRYQLAIGRYADMPIAEEAA